MSSPVITQSATVTNGKAVITVQVVTTNSDGSTVTNISTTSAMTRDQVLNMQTVLSNTQGMTDAKLTALAAALTDNTLV